MTSFGTALWVASLALVGKVVFDLWDRFRDRRGVAAALAGELRAYIDLLDQPQTWANYRHVAGMERESRVRFLKAMPSLPSGHPVFDKIADRIGCLPHSAASEVSRSYNVVTGLRCVLTGMATIGFQEVDDGVQSARLNFIADMMEIEILRSQSIIQFLQLISRQSMLDWIIDRDLMLLERLV